MASPYIDSATKKLKRNENRGDAPFFRMLSAVSPESEASWGYICASPQHPVSRQKTAAFFSEILYPHPVVSKGKLWYNVC